MSRALLGERIKLLRVARGFVSAAALANAAGLKTAAVVELESGRRKYGVLDSLVAVAQTLDTPVEDLVCPGRYICIPGLLDQLASDFKLSYQEVRSLHAVWDEIVRLKQKGAGALSILAQRPEVLTELLHQVDSQTH